jgi:hypothetical protein
MKLWNLLTLVICTKFFFLKSKEIKIFFDDDKVSDAGGLQREWIHLIIKELCDSKLGFLQRTDT